MRDWPSNPELLYTRAVFLDRDGTINVDTHYPHDYKLLEVIPEAYEGMKILSELPLDIIVVSNQAGIELGIFTKDQMSRFNEELRIRIERYGGRIDAFYYCPHLEPKNLKKGQKPCNCSKPAPGMLLEAANDFEIDLAKSFIIGDKTSDVAAGKVVGCTGILVKTGKAGKEDGFLPIKIDHLAENLYEAAIMVKTFVDEEYSDTKDLNKKFAIQQVA
jgi:D-glycero-D-manno-heptose 1,7-bisphosphate phosphatase